MDLAQAKEIWKDLQSIVGDGKVSPQTYKVIPWTASKAYKARGQKIIFLHQYCSSFYGKEPTEIIGLHFKLK